MNRVSVRLAAWFAVAMIAPVLPAPAQTGSSNGIAAPAPADNQLNGTANQMQKTNNDANAAAGGGTLNNATSSASDATAATADHLKNTADADAAGAGTPSVENPAPAAKDIRKTLGKVVGETMEKGDMDDLIGYFTDTDRDRIKKSDSYDQSYGEKLDGRIEQLQQAWKTKYGHEFGVKHANKLFADTFAHIEQAQVGQGSDVETVVKALGGDDADLQPGRAVAIVDVAASHELPDLKLSLVHQLPDSWKLDVPNDLDASKLRAHLLDQFTVLGDHTDLWPAEEDDAYRAFTHRVLMALLNKPSLSQSTGAAEMNSMSK